MIPKIIFMYWHDTNYPQIVSFNIKKLKKLHPDYKIHIINRETVSKFVNIEQYNFNFNDKLLKTHAYFSDILRILLLEKYGGIWIDASLIFWKRIDNIVKENNKLVLIRNYNNDNGVNNKGYESWFIASIPKHPFIVHVKNKVVSLNKYKKINKFLNSTNFIIQKNKFKEYHLIYHIMSYVQQMHPYSLKESTDYDSKLLYPNNHIENKTNIPFTNSNLTVFNWTFISYYFSAIKIKKYIKYGEPKNIIASKLTSNMRKYINNIS